MCCLVAPSLPEIEAEHGRLGKTVSKTGPGLWALWNIGKAEAIWKSPGAEEIPSNLVPWSHQSGGLSPGSDCLVLGQSSWQSRQKWCVQGSGQTFGCVRMESGGMEGMGND